LQEVLRGAVGKAIGKDFTSALCLSTAQSCAGFLVDPHLNQSLAGKLWACIFYDILRR